MPEISDEELAKFKAHEESAKKLEAKNAELLNEKKAEKSAREAAEALVKQKELDELKAKEDYKGLYEKMDADAKIREANDKERTEKLSRGAKLSAVQNEFAKLGINPERVTSALRLVDLTDVKYDENTNTVLGADIAASKIKLSMPEIFVKADKENVTHDDSNFTPPENMSNEWFAGLSAADQDKHYPAFMKAQGVEVRGAKK
jgi:hypothetical protein